MSIVMKTVAVLVATIALWGAGAGVAAAATPTGATMRPTLYVLRVAPVGGQPVCSLTLSGLGNQVITIVRQPGGRLAASIHQQPDLRGATVVADYSGQALDVTISRAGTVVDHDVLGSGAQQQVNL